jgi:hypothetical protein
VALRRRRAKRVSERRLPVDELVLRLTQQRDQLLPELADMDPGDLLLILQCLLTPVGSGRRFFLREESPEVYVL